ncbi:MAG TPA: DUF5320 domain-containing protein [archaeon]|nr:DUF5320 domain-containing protein [archaeon]
MPNIDMTGPNGIGPMSGRGLGKCNNQTNQNLSNNNFGRRGGFGRGCGRGFGRGCSRDFSCRKGQGRRFFLENQKQEETNKDTLLKELQARKAEIDNSINEIESKN